MLLQMQTLDKIVFYPFVKSGKGFKGFSVFIIDAILTIPF